MAISFTSLSEPLSLHLFMYISSVKRAFIKLTKLIRNEYCQ